MNRHPNLSRRLSLLCMMGLLFVSTFLRAESLAVDYVEQIRPVLQKYCSGCHNDDDAESGFSVSSVAAMNRGGESGKVMVAGDSANSRMIQMVLGKLEPVMPPEDEPQPSDEETALLVKWVDAGAKAPEGEPAMAITPPEIRPVTEVAPAVTGVDWSSQNMIAVSRFGRVELLDGDTLATVREINEFPGKVNAVRFSRDGERLCVASGITGLSGQATVWRVADGQLLRSYEGHRDSIYAALESPDASFVATASYDRHIILWDAASGRRLHDITGHNGAVYDLDFSGDSRHLISASGDQTVKVWNVDTGARLDTLGQPLKEQYATRFSPDDRLIVGGGRDHRIRVWEFVSRKVARINPLLHARFAHEAPIVALEFSADGSRLVTSSEDRTIKIWETANFEQVGVLENQSDVCAALAIAPDASHLFVGRLDGTVQRIAMPPDRSPNVAAGEITTQRRRDSGGTEPPQPLEESEPNDSPDGAQLVGIPSVVSGRIAGDEDGPDNDLYRVRLTAGQQVTLTIRAARDKSPLDSFVEVLDNEGQRIPRVVLQALRDSYFAFRGKDSSTIDDYRVHNWEEMQLNDYLYANGEVVKLYMRPRGPDSGFRVYPNFGQRHTFFGTTPMSHALHEPCYIVRPFPAGTRLQPNGLPTFTVYFENDDDPLRKFGSDSHLMFTAPSAGDYFVRVTDVRGFSGEDYKYKLTIAPPHPGFTVKMSPPAKLYQGSGQEFSLRADRIDGFQGPIQVHVENVPDSLSITTPLQIEANHFEAFGTVHWKLESPQPTPEELSAIRLRATAEIAGESAEEQINGFGKVEFQKQPKIRVRIVPLDVSVEEAFQSPSLEPLKMQVRAGERLAAKVVVERRDHTGRISFGGHESGRNLPHGVFVADIGLNGLMITEGQQEQSFFISTEPWVQPMKRPFHVRANDVQSQASPPVYLEILPRDEGFATIPSPR